VAQIHVWRTPGGVGTDLVVVTLLDVYAQIHSHSMRALPAETGGFLLGTAGYDAASATWHLHIDEAVPIEPVENTPVHFAFSWREVDNVRRRREEQGKALLGWYHTHPDMGIFLSDTDLDRTHRILFSEPFQVALVYDPVRQRAGYFFWEGTQSIDASPALWREFTLIGAAGAGDHGDTPPVSGVDSSETLSVPSPEPVEQAPNTNEPPLEPERRFPEDRPEAASSPPSMTPDPPVSKSAVTGQPVSGPFLLGVLVGGILFVVLAAVLGVIWLAKP